MQTYREFLAATLLLKEALGKEETAQITRLLADRDNLAGKVDSLDHKLVGYEGGGRQTKTAADMAELLRCIAVVNKDCEALAAGKCAVLKKDIAMVHQQKEGWHGYTAPGKNAPFFLSINT